MKNKINNWFLKSDAEFNDWLIKFALLASIIVCIGEFLAALQRFSLVGPAQ